MADFEVGDVVVLASGGPTEGMTVMTVEACADDTTCVTVAWFDSNDELRSTQMIATAKAELARLDMMDAEAQGDHGVGPDIFGKACSVPNSMLAGLTPPPTAL